MLVLLTSTWLVLLLASPVYSWGQAGHEIVATIAQTQLHPLVREHICSILPNYTQYNSSWPPAKEDAKQVHCHLAVLASWPDTLRFRMPWSSRLHYVNPVDDHPPRHCTYGENGWTSNDNILYSMVNYTSRLTTQKGQQRDEALRFLVHFFGDSHQPLHLTGRARGGNDIWVHFEGRKAKLHSVWDGLIINKHIRELSNYTSPLPSGRIESALRGKVYDPYIRWIIKEGLGQPARQNLDKPAWWSDQAPTWTSCGQDKVFEASQSQHVFDLEDPSRVDETDLPICPYHWTKPMHPLVCQYAFASPVPEWEEPPTNVSKRGTEPPPLPELDVPEYLGRIDSDKVIQLQLAKAGVRLAAVLNTLLLDEAKQANASRNRAGT